MQAKVANVNPQEARAKLNIPEDAKVVGIIGRMVDVKGHVPFLQSVIKNWQKFSPLNPYFLLVGDGPLRQAIESSVIGTPLASRLVLTGAIPDISEPLRVIDLLVISSYTEGLPINLIEAGAVGTQVISTAVGGVPFVLSEHLDWLVPPGEFELLAEKVAAALNS